jgi:hypothetical protein
LPNHVEELKIEQHDWQNNKSGSKGEESHEPMLFVSKIFKIPELKVS